MFLRQFCYRGDLSLSQISALGGAEGETCLLPWYLIDAYNTSSKEVSAYTPPFQLTVEYKSLLSKTSNTPIL